MARTVIKINGEELPVVLTMGAIRTYKEEFNKEFEQIRTMNDIGDFLYCCAKVGARVEKKSFDMTPTEFADALEFKQASDVFNTLMGTEGVEKGDGKDTKKK